YRVRTLHYLTTFRDCFSSLFWLGKVRRLKDRGEKFVLSIDLYVFSQSTYASAYHIWEGTYASAYYILHLGDRPTRQRTIFRGGPARQRTIFRRGPARQRTIFLCRKIRLRVSIPYF